MFVFKYDQRNWFISLRGCEASEAILGELLSGYFGAATPAGG